MEKVQGLVASFTAFLEVKKGPIEMPCCCCLEMGAHCYIHSSGRLICDDCWSTTPEDREYLGLKPVSKHPPAENKTIVQSYDTECAELILGDRMDWEPTTKSIETVVKTQECV